MQQQGQQGLARPIPLPAQQNQNDLQQLLELVRMGGMQQNNRSAFSSLGVVQAPTLPEFSLFNNLQSSGLFKNQQVQNDQLVQLQQWQNLQAMQNLQRQAAPTVPGLNLFGSAQTQTPASSGTSLSRGASKGDKHSNAYASRHQAAEQRRRTRINDRLERLREVVPHSERANTATFLEEVITYVEGLKERMTILEKAQGLQPTCLPTPKEERGTLMSTCPTCSQGGSGSHDSRDPPPILPHQHTVRTTTQGSPPAVPAHPSPAPAPAGTGAVQKEVPNTPPQSVGKEVVNNTAACGCAHASHQNLETAGSGSESASKRAKIATA